MCDDKKVLFDSDKCLQMDDAIYSFLRKSLFGRNITWARVDQN